MALYDPNEFPEARSDTEALLAAFLAWARTKPADLEYCYYDADDCAVSQFGRETGRNHLVRVIDLSVDYPALEAAVNHEDMAFGALVSRLEAAL